MRRSRWRAESAGPAREQPGFQVRRQGALGSDREPAIVEAVQHAKAGDPDALRYLYTRHADQVFGYVLGVVQDEHEAEDITQQVFMKLLTVFHMYEPRQVPFAAWIMRVARNAALDHLRRRRQIPCEDVFGPDAVADDLYRERRTDLSEALATLPQEQRDVIVLRHIVGLRPGEIAGRMGKTDASIHGLHHRARQALRTELERLDARPVTLAA
jgi:RNA polymerase sigma-70 factor (ECF subfamily)